MESQQSVSKYERKKTEKMPRKSLVEAAGLFNPAESTLNASKRLRRSSLLTKMTPEQQEAQKQAILKSIQEHKAQGNSNNESPGQRKR
jgi:hypothetical protein